MEGAYTVWRASQELPWKMPTRFGVPLKMLKATHQFHDGRRACVRADGGEQPESFDVAKEL